MFENAMGFLPQAINILEGIGLVVVAANAITALTPTQLDNKAQQKAVTAINVALRVLNTLSVNFGKNRNADDVLK